MSMHPTLSLLVLCLFVQAASAWSCTQKQLIIETAHGPIPFEIEIANDRETRATGLSGRTSLSKRSGMLFVYRRPHRAMFWMMGTKIPLDMIFIESDGTIAGIKYNVQPGSYWPQSAGRNVIAVFEINGGEANEFNIAVDDKIYHPLISCSIRQ